MERLAAKMGGTVKFPYNESECLDADFFKVHYSNMGCGVSSFWIQLLISKVENFYLLKIHLNLFEIPNQVLKFENLI